MLAVEVGRGVALPLSNLVYVFLFLAPNRPSKFAIEASSSTTTTTTYCCDLCLRSRGCSVASYNSSYTAARAASACCLLQQLRSWLLLAYFSNYVKTMYQGQFLWTYVSQNWSEFHRWSGKEQVSCHNFGCFWWSLLVYVTIFQAPPTAKLHLPVW